MSFRPPRHRLPRRLLLPLLLPFLLPSSSPAQNLELRAGYLRMDPFYDGLGDHQALVGAVVAWEIGSSWRVGYDFAIAHNLELNAVRVERHVTGPVWFAAGAGGVRTPGDIDWAAPIAVVLRLDRVSVTLQNAMALGHRESGEIGTLDNFSLAVGTGIGGP